LDVEGHPANYVETEQIIQYDGECTSFVQVKENYTNSVMLQSEA
jgi:hypothetical protein